MTIIEAQAVQKDFDSAHWEVNSDDLSKIRHIMLHLATLIGKVGRYCERAEHGIAQEQQILEREVVPDLLIYSLQAANLLGVELEEAYRTRLSENAHKFTREEATQCNGSKTVG